MGSTPRLTGPVLAILQAFAADPAREQYGLELMDSTHLRSGTLYPALLRLCDSGILSLRREDIDTSAAGRAARTYYRLTSEGLLFAKQALAYERARTKRTRPPIVRPRLGET